MILGAKLDFTDREVQLLDDYWTKGGRVMILLNPDTPTPHLAAFLARLGVQVDDDRVLRTVDMGTVTGIVRDVYTQLVGDTAVATGALSSAVLVANNLRDIPTDEQAGKITLAVRLGDARTRVLYQVLVALAFVLTLVLIAATPWCAVGLVALPLAVRAAAPVRSGRGGRELIPVLRDTGLTMLVWSVAVAAALAFG